MTEVCTDLHVDRLARNLLRLKLCAADRCPLAVEVFACNTADPATVGPSMYRIRRRFGVTRIALIGYRGMLTTARRPEDLAWPAWTGSRPVAASPCARCYSAQSRIPGEDPEAAQAPRRPGQLVPDQVVEIRSPNSTGESLLSALPQAPASSPANRPRVESSLFAPISSIEQT